MNENCCALKNDAMLAAYAALQNGNINSAKELLITGIAGGSVNNALDIERLNKEWKEDFS